MTIGEGISIATQVCVFLGVIGNIVQNFINGRQIEKVHEKVETVEHATNSMKDDLVAAVRSEAFQAGKLEQQESTKSHS